METYSRKRITELITQGKQIINTSDVENVLSILSEKGYDYNLEQKNFLNKYLGFTITFDSPRAKGYTETFTVDPVQTAINIDKDMVDEYENYTNSKFLTLGEIPEEEMVVFLNDHDVIYGCNEEYLITLGNSLEEFLFNVMNGIQMTLEKMK